MTDASSDLALVKRALDGGRDARRELAGRLLDAVHREVGRCLIQRAVPARRDPRQEVSDLVQEVLVALFDRDSQELRRWDPERGRSLDSFVRLVARRRVARILGQRRGNPWSEAPIDPERVDANDAGAAAARLEERGELDTVLGALNARMSVRDHELFDLLYVQQLDPDEVAGAMEMTRSAVNAWAYRMRKVARALADQVGASPEGQTPPRGKVTYGR